MRTITKLVPLALFGAATALQACGSTKSATLDTGEFPVKGVIRGTLTYSGSAPCSQNGHIVGNAIILVFDRRNPPPPAGLANTAINFVAISGDNLFANWPRTPDNVKRCPDPSQIVAASAPFAIAPMDPGSYLIQAFYDYTGNFLPTFKIRNLPEATDIGGGFIDLNDATSLETDFSQQIGVSPSGAPIYAQIPKQSDPNYQPIFLPVDIGVPGTVPHGSLRGVPTFTMPPQGYIADNVAVTIGARLGLTRPYFYPEGVSLPALDSKGNALTNPAIGLYGTSADIPGSSAIPAQTTPQNNVGDASYQPVMTFPASLQVYAQPSGSAATVAPDSINQYQVSFPQLRLRFGVPDPEKGVASNQTDPHDPFHMQLSPAEGGNGGVFVWWDGNHNNPLLNSIPETPLVAKMWPLVVLAKLKDDPDHSRDPQSLTAQGSDGKQPVVIIQAITLLGDSLLQMAAEQRGCIESAPGNKVCSELNARAGETARYIQEITRPDPQNLQDHVTVIVRPSAVCFDPNHIDIGGVLVTPHFKGDFPPGDKSDTSPGDVVNIANLQQNPQITGLVRDFREACVPPGKYGINVVYPTGQAWTVPNEAGHCAPSEGSTMLNTNDAPGDCSLKSRPVLNSQGTRAVVEVLDDPAYCTGSHAVPPECLVVP